MSFKIKIKKPVYKPAPKAATKKKKKKSSSSNTTTYRRTKHTRANGTVYYTYPNEASRRYYENKYKKPSSGSSGNGGGFMPPGLRPEPPGPRPITTWPGDGKIAPWEVEGKEKLASGTTKPVLKNLGQAIKEARTKGLDYVVNKYGENLSADWKSKLQQILANTSNRAKGKFKAQAGRFADGGPAAQSGVAPFKRQMNFNLDNDLDLAQGSQHEWAMPSSISSIISGQLRQAANSPVDLFETWAQDKVGTLTMSNRSTPFGVDAGFQFSPMEDLAQSNPMGAFGTNAVMEDYGAMQSEEAEDGPATDWTFGGFGDPNDTFSSWYKDYNDYKQWRALDAAGQQAAYKKAGDAQKKIWEQWKSSPNYFDEYDQDALNNATEAQLTALTKYEDAADKAFKISMQGSFAEFWNAQHPNQAKILSADGQWITPPKDSTLPMIDNMSGTPSDNVIFGDKPQTYYNPWSRLEGGATNQYGPSQQLLAQGQMEAMALANAYFAPQRMELAYELGDMETDMRRLAVNLGRQIDDPVLQAKLYKEASRATRTLDIQQNTFAFQMAESRRSQDIANWQFYDQLAAQEAQLKLANRQFYDKLEIDKRMYNLHNWAAQQNAAAQKTQPPPSSVEESQGGNLLNPYLNTKYQTF